MYDAVYPVIGKQSCFPFYLSGVGMYSPENHTVRREGLISHQILFTLEGEGRLHIDNKTFRVRKGCVFFVMPGVPHEYYSIDGNWTTCWVVFRGDNLQNLMKKLGFPSYICRKVSEIRNIKRIFDNIFASAKYPVRGDEKCSILVYEYIMAVRRALLLDTDCDTGNVIDAGLTYMNENYHKDISLQELSKMCSISQQHFCRVFRLETGMRPMEYLAQKRMLEAKLLLHTTDKSIAEIGRQTGYHDPTYFGMVFKKYEGISPSQYRKMKKSVVI